MLVTFIVVVETEMIVLDSSNIVRHGIIGLNMPGEGRR